MKSNIKIISREIRMHYVHVIKINPIEGNIQKTSTLKNEKYLKDNYLNAI